MKTTTTRTLIVLAGISLTGGIVHAQPRPTKPTLGPKEAASLLAEPEFVREGEGARREALNRRERQPFDSTLWARLTGWTNGSALTKTDTDGKVVVVLTWTDYLPTSRRMPALATRLAQQHGKDGLIVVLVHGQQQFENATKPAAPEGTSLLVAHDASGEFRKALDVDGDPDVYVIDRAGQLRFADLTLESLNSAVEKLIKEDASAAAGLNDRLAQDAADRDRAARRAAAANTEASFIKFPVLEFPEPSEAEYEKAKWPPRPPDHAKLNEDPKAQMEAKEITLPEDNYFPNKPDMKGKVTITYDWHPKIGLSYNGIFEWADYLQTAYGRDVVVLGVMSPFAENQGFKLAKDANEPDALRKDFNRFIQSRKFQHYLVDNIEGATVRSQADQDSTLIVPVAMIISTDGRVRWWQREEDGGPPIAFEAALIEILKNDPGVKARRKVEDEWLAKQTDKKALEVVPAIDTPVPTPVGVP